MLADAARMAAPPGHEGAHGGVHARRPFAQASPGNERKTIGMSPSMDRAGEGLQKEFAEHGVVVTHASPQIGDGDQDGLPSLCSNLGRSETEGLDLTRREALQHDVGLTHETPYPSQPVRRAQIGHDAALRGIEPFEEGTRPVWLVAQSRGPPPPERVPLRTLHLDRVGSPVDQQLGAVRAPRSHWSGRAGAGPRAAWPCSAGYVIWHAIHAKHAPTTETRERLQRQMFPGHPSLSGRARQY